MLPRPPDSFTIGAVLVARDQAAHLPATLAGIPRRLLRSIVVVDSAAHGAVKVQLPARWNLCRATGIDTASTLRPGDRVRVVGTATDPDTLTVCDGAKHALQRL